MDIQNLTDQVNPVYTEPKFIELAESHLTYLRTHPDAGHLTVTPMEADVYTGDFYGLLQIYHFPSWTHYLILRTNGYLSQTDYDGKYLTFLIPPMDELELLREIYLSSQL